MAGQPDATMSVELLLGGITDILKEVKKVMKQVQRSITGADLRLEVDTRTGMDQVGDLVDRVRRAAANGETIDLQVDAGTSPEVVQELRRQLSGLSDVDLRVTTNTTGDAEIRQLLDDVNRIDGASASARVRVDSSGAESGIREIRSDLEGLQGTADDVGSGIAAALTAGFAAVTGAAAVEGPLELQRAITTAQTQLDKGIDPTKFANSVKEAYNGIGSDIDATQVATQFAGVYNAMGNDADAEKAISTIINLKRQTGKELDGLISGFRSFQLAYKNSDPSTVLDDFATASQAIDGKGELFDVMEEYSAQLEKAGFSSSQTAAILKTMATNAWSLDKALDAVKESVIFDSETLETVKATLTGLGNVDLKKLFDQYDQGALSSENFIKSMQGLAKEGKISAEQLQQMTDYLNDAEGNFTVEVDLEGIEKDLSKLPDKLPPLVYKTEIDNSSDKAYKASLDKRAKEKEQYDKKVVDNEKKRNSAILAADKSVQTEIAKREKEAEKIRADRIKNAEAQLPKYVSGSMNPYIEALNEQFIQSGGPIRDYAASLLELLDAGKITEKEFTNISNGIFKGAGEDLGVEGIRSLVTAMQEVSSVSKDANAGMADDVSAMADANQDAFQKMSKSWREFQSGPLLEFVNAMMPTLTAMAEFGTLLLKVTGDFAVAHPQVTAWVSAIAAFLLIAGPIVAAFKAIGSGIKGVYGAFLKLGPVLSKIGKFFTFLNGVIAYFFSGGGVLGAIGRAGLRAVPIIGTLFLVYDLIRWLVSLFGVKLPSVLDLLKVAWDAVWGGILYLVEKVVNWFQTGVEKMNALTDAFRNGGISGFIAEWGNQLAETFEWFTKILQKLGLIKDESADVVENMKEIDPTLDAEVVSAQAKIQDAYRKSDAYKQMAKNLPKTQEQTDAEDNAAMANQFNKPTDPGAFSRDMEARAAARIGVQNNYYGQSTKTINQNLALGRR